MNKRLLRRRFLVDWKLQGSLCAHGLLYGGLVLVAISCGIFVPLLWNLGDTSQAPGLDDQAVVMLYMHERFWILALACFAIVVLGSVRFSHRIAGPLVRFKRNLRLLAQGKLPDPLRTRRNDYLKEEVAYLNDAVAGIAERLDAIRSAQLAVRREVLAAAARAPSHAAPELSPLLAASQALEQSLAAFERFDTQDDLPVPEPAAAPSQWELASPGSGVGG